MSSLQSSDARIALVEIKYGLSVETYKSRPELVVALMNNGGLGGGNYYGCPEHKAALDKIEQTLKEVRTQIRKEAKRDAGITYRERRRAQKKGGAS